MRQRSAPIWTNDKNEDTVMLRDIKKLLEEGDVSDSVNKHV